MHGYYPPQPGYRMPPSSAYNHYERARKRRVRPWIWVGSISGLATITALIVMLAVGHTAYLCSSGVGALAQAMDSSAMQECGRIYIAHLLSVAFLIGGGFVTAFSVAAMLTIYFKH